MKIFWKLLVLLISGNRILQATRLEFTPEEIRKLNGSCHAEGPCQDSSPKCVCKNDCYDDWLWDTTAPKIQCCKLKTESYIIPKVIDPIFNYECIGNSYMKRDCAYNWRQENVKEQCIKARTYLFKYNPLKGASPNTIADPFLSTPVTSKITNVTYYNYYCAICNDENLADLDAWSLEISFEYVVNHYADKINVNDTFIVENLQYINGTWGIYKNDFRRLLKDDLYQLRMLNKFVKEEFVHFNFHLVAPVMVTGRSKWCDESLIDICDPNWTDPFIEKLCCVHEGMVYDNKNDKKYRNYHCAICNFVEISNLNCTLIRHLEENYEPPSWSLSAILDFSVKENLCSYGQIWDSLSKKCWLPLLDTKSIQYNVNRNISDTANKVNLYKNAIEVSNTTDLSKIKGNGTSCDVKFINETDFIPGPNLTIFVNSSSKRYKPNEYVLHKDGILVCIYPNKSEIMAWLSLIGLSLSCICFLLHFLAFCIVPDLRNVSGKNLTSLCLALMAAYICFICSSFKDSTTGGCRTLASFMYYFFMASFMWMNVMAFDIWLTFHLSTSKYQVISGHQWKKFLCYSLYAWLVPFIALTTVLVIDHLRPSFVSEAFVPELGLKSCWLGQSYAILIYFAIPLAVIMIINTIFFVLAARTVTMASKSSTLNSTTKPYHLQLKLYIKLALLMGLGWTSGVVGGYVQNEYLWYFFIPVNAFQGVYILIAYTCTKKIRRAFIIHKKRLPKVSLRGFQENKHLEIQETNTSKESNTKSTNTSDSATNSTPFTE